jgi:predicted transcriptional regulator of viral defense system
MIHLPPLPPLLLTGTILRREALLLGLSGREVEALLGSGAWVRVRPGAYAERATWDVATREQRHLLRAKAVLRSLEEPAVLAHVSAAVAHGLPVWGADLSLVHVVRPARRHGARVEAGVAHHSAELPPEHVTAVDGLPVTTVARTVIDHSRTTHFEAGVVTADAAMNRRHVTPEDLRDLLFWQRDWPQARAAGRVTAFADGLAESVGESRGRVCFHLNGLPAPKLQFEVRDHDGVLLGRADFAFLRQRTLGEFDGRMKYRSTPDGPSADDILWAEKQREDGIRALGWEFVRFIWLDFQRPAVLVRRFHDAFSRGLARPAT